MLSATRHFPLSLLFRHTTHCAPPSFRVSRPESSSPSCRQALARDRPSRSTRFSQRHTSPTPGVLISPAMKPRLRRATCWTAHRGRWGAGSPSMSGASAPCRRARPRRRCFPRAPASCAGPAAPTLAAAALSATPRKAPVPTHASVTQALTRRQRRAGRKRSRRTRPREAACGGAVRGSAGFGPSRCAGQLSPPW